MTSRTIDAEFLSGPLTAGESFATYPTVRTTERFGPIPTWTLGDAVCCNPRSEGCAKPEGDTDGPFHTSQSDGCTDAVCNC